MIIYYDKTGNLLTQIMHGDKPRQGGSLKIKFYFDSDYMPSIGDEVYAVYVQYRTLSMSSNSADYVCQDDGVETFQKISLNENIGSLIDGKAYRCFSIDLSDTGAVEDYGNLNLMVKVTTFNVQLDSEGNVDQYSLKDKKFEGNAVINVEQTLGLVPDSGIGMTRSEYETILAYLTALETTFARLTGTGFSDENRFNIYAKKLTILDKITGNLTPSISNQYTLGTNKKYWKNLYANTIRGENDIKIVDASTGQEFKLGSPSSHLYLWDNGFDIKTAKGKIFVIDKDKIISDDATFGSLKFSKKQTILSDTGSVSITDEWTNDSDQISTTNRIKIGGREFVARNSEKEIIFAFKPANSKDEEIAPFVISKDGVTYYQGYEIVNSNNLETQIAEERNRAIKKEDELTGAINNEKNRATDAEEGLSSSISNEVTRATQEEDKLDNKIEGEKTRATQEENKLDNKIEGEKTRATQEENKLTEAINEEVRRATEVENTIKGVIGDSFKDNSDYVNSTVEAAIVTIDDKITKLRNNLNDLIGGELDNIDLDTIKEIADKITEINQEFNKLEDKFGSLLNSVQTDVQSIDDTSSVDIELKINTDYTLTDTTHLNSINIIIPDDIAHGFYSTVNFLKRLDGKPELNIKLTTAASVKFGTKVKYIQDGENVDKLNFPTNECIVKLFFECDGLFIYCMAQTF